MARRLLTAVAVFAVTVGLGAVQAQAEPVRSTVAARGENPSGKLNDAGQPLHVRPAGRDKPVPKVEASAAVAQAECPADLACEFIPAAYHLNNPADITDWGNYDLSDRPANGLKIDKVVIHATEGSTIESAIAAFQDPLYYVSAHYIIGPTGRVVQMVQNRNVAWHAGNYYLNQHSIGIEHVGYEVSGRTDFTPEMYAASAKLVEWLAHRYNIPLDSSGITGHDNVPASTGGGIAGMHIDPGPFWDWQGYMGRMGVAAPSGGSYGRVVTIAPRWERNKPPVTDCDSGTCVPVPTQSANFVYVRTAPNAAAPLVTDPVLGQGTTAYRNTAAKIYYGARVAVKDRRCDWLQVWYAGTSGWIYNPENARVAFSVPGKYITPKPGMASIPVYGRAYPEASAYPADFTGAPVVVALPYTIAAGQRYAISDAPTTDYYRWWSYNGSLKYDGTLFKGSDRYWQVFLNGRQYFVRAADVVVIG